MAARRLRGLTQSGAVRCSCNRPYPVLTYRKRVFDVRALVQRREDGEWALTGMVARLGAPTRKVTNIHAGGKARSLETVLAEAGAGAGLIEGVGAARRRAGPRRHERRRPILEARRGAGVDVIDKEYRCWLIEVNSRTGRISFTAPG